MHYCFLSGNPATKDIDIAFFGKGLTFDTGGLNLKSTGSIEDMYYDKASECAVMRALKDALKLGIKKNVIFAMGFAENAIDAKKCISMDIIKFMKGLTVEIETLIIRFNLFLLIPSHMCKRNTTPKIGELGYINRHYHGCLRE
jgi:hypothetical protein